MARSGWRRFLLDRSQWMLLTIVLMGLVAGVGFINLGLAYSAANAANRAAHAQLAEAQQQQALLLQALAEAQQGAHIAPKAYDYFGQTPPEVTTILIVPPAAEPEIARPAGTRHGPPFWGEWWERLVNP